MGSLTAGWNSPAFRSGKASLERRSSFTKIEIDHYRKAKRDQEEEHQKAAEELSAQRSQTVNLEAATADTRGSMSIETVLENLSNYKDWWTKSNWAFLNEPKLVLEENYKNRYATQHHIAAQAIQTNSS